MSDRERLSGYIEGMGKIILPEPESLLTKSSKMPGLDGQKMSKSYNNTISLRDKAEEVDKKIKRMPTDPARVKLTDPGDPQKCPVWQLHQVYSDAQTRDWVVDGCTKAKMGCVECKMPVIDAVNQELAPMQESISKYQSDPELIRQIIFDGSERARNVAKETIIEVREAMGITY
jgi:tryptophanyl-tRNA synthetase